ncbi:MAG: 3-hydroxybutyryl-CoA dehydrogenase [Acidobacteriota bacterium]
MTAEIKEIGVVGAGTMGSGIAQVCAVRGLNVILCDTMEAQLEKAHRSIERNLDREVQKERLSPSQKSEILPRLQLTSEIGSLAQVGFVVEAVPEDFQIKKKVLGVLDQTCSREAILATNTSSISITKLAGVTGRPDRVVGMHFMNPVPVMKLVEVIRGYRTSRETLDTTLKLTERLGKTAVEASDSPGFVSNRVLIPMINEAVFCVYEGVGSVEAVDTVMKLGMNHPMGPLALADLIGLDVCLDIMETLYSGFRDSKYRPCPLLEKMVSAGLLGRKSGEGFYRYSQ